MCTFKISSLIVNVHVAIEGELSMYSQATHSALQFLFFVDRSHMLLVGNFTDENFIANLTGNLVIFNMISMNVLAQIELAVKLQGTMLATVRLHSVVPVHVTIHSLLVYAFAAQIADDFVPMLVQPVVVLPELCRRHCFLLFGFPAGGTLETFLLFLTASFGIFLQCLLSAREIIFRLYTHMLKGLRWEGDLIDATIKNCLQLKTTS